MTWSHKTDTPVSGGHLLYPVSRYASWSTRISNYMFIPQTCHLQRNDCHCKYCRVHSLCVALLQILYLWHKKLWRTNVQRLTCWLWHTDSTESLPSWKSRTKTHQRISSFQSTPGAHWVFTASSFWCITSLGPRTHGTRAPKPPWEKFAVLYQ